MRNKGCVIERGMGGRSFPFLSMAAGVGVCVCVWVCMTEGERESEGK